MTAGARFPPRGPGARSIRLIRSGLFTGLCALSPLAAGAEDLGASVRRCAAEPVKDARLDCYDRAAHRPEAAVAASATTAATATAAMPSAGAATETPRMPARDRARAEAFGREALRERPHRDEAPDRISDTLAGVDAGRDELAVLHLANGQTWQQSERGPDLHLKAGDAVRIERGVLGAYWLSVERSRLAIKVRRVR